MKAAIAPAHARHAYRDLAVSVIGLALLLLWDASGWDLALTRLFGTPHGFPLRNHWFTAGVLHQGGRYLSVLLFGLAVAIAARPFGPWRGLTRCERWAGFAVMVACLLIVPAIKRASATSCPWSLQEFGGAAHYVSHWRWGVADGGPGRCFPSGHASGAFSFLVLSFWLRPRRPRAARGWLVAIVVLGLVFGAAQLVRGAHYASHTLYTAWLCWTLTALVFAWLERRTVHAPASPRDP